MNVVWMYGHVRKMRHLIVDGLDLLEEAVSQLAGEVEDRARDEIIGTEIIIPVLGDIGTAYKKGMEALRIIHSFEDEILKGLIDLMERIMEWLIKEKGYNVSKIGIVSDPELVPCIEVEVPGIDFDTAREVAKEIRNEFGLGILDVLVIDKVTVPILSLEELKELKGILRQDKE